MISLLKHKFSSLTLIYGSTMIVLLGIILGILLRIQSRYANEFINLRFNVYENVAIIDSASYVWQYGAYALAIVIINGIGIRYIQQRFTNRSIQAIIGYWIFGVSVSSLSLFIIYLWIILRINS